MTFTADDVLNAIRAGHNTVDLLAAHFKVPAASYNLRADLRDLAADRRIIVADVTADGIRVFVPAEVDLTRTANACLVHAVTGPNCPCPNPVDTYRTSAANA